MEARLNREELKQKLSRGQEVACVGAGGESARRAEFPYYCADWPSESCGRTMYEKVPIVCPRYEEPWKIRVISTIWRVGVPRPSSPVISSPLTCVAQRVASHLEATHTPFASFRGGFPRGPGADSRRKTPTRRGAHNQPSVRCGVCSVISRAQ